jgi:uncharacterized protein YeaO (DUF488 family)
MQVEISAAGGENKGAADRWGPNDFVNVDLWLKEIAPSNTFRRRFHGDPGSWEEFKTAYFAELEWEPAQSAARDLLDRQTRGPVTLLFAARDETRNNAVALREWLDLRAADVRLKEICPSHESYAFLHTLSVSELTLSKARWI